MTPDSSPIVLYDARENCPIEGILIDTIGDPQFQDWERLWIPSLMDAIKQLAAEGKLREKWPESAHWNWRAKISRIQGLLAHQTFSVMCQDVTQGMMQIDLTRNARLPGQKGKPLAYISYLETAPWNRATLFTPPHFQGVGSILVRAAIQVSLDQGFQGRIGLHALPQADRFYANTCGMTFIGPDSAEQNLGYFEMTPEQANIFVGGV